MLDWFLKIIGLINQGAIRAEHEDRQASRDYRNSLNGGYRMILRSKHVRALIIFTTLTRNDGVGPQKVRLPAGMRVLSLFLSKSW
jgi:hypothetical protein